MKTEKNEFGFVVRGSAGKSRPVQLLFCFWWARATCDNPCRSILAYSVGTVVAAVVDLYVAVEGYSRQCHSNRIMEESWSVVNKCCCLFCDETSNMAHDTNSWRHLFTHIVWSTYWKFRLNMFLIRFLIFMKDTVVDYKKLL